MFSHSANMEEQQQQEPLMNIRKRRDVLRKLGDEEIVKRYRLNRARILFVTDLVRGPAK